MYDKKEEIRTAHMSSRNCAYWNGSKIDKSSPQLEESIKYFNRNLFQSQICDSVCLDIYGLKELVQRSKCTQAYS